MENIDELINKLALDTAEVKLAPHPYVLSLKWVGWAVAYLAVSLMLSGLRPDWMVMLHEPLFVAELVVLAGIFISTSISASLLAFPDLHQKRGAAFAPVLMFALFVLVIALAWNSDNPPSPLPMHSFECTISIMLVALLPAVWTFFSMRKFASTHFHWAGSVAVLSAFSIGALWLRLHELNNSILHLVEWHYLPMLASAIGGLWLGKKILNW